jgi:hypothetical protein
MFLALIAFSLKRLPGRTLAVRLCGLRHYFKVEDYAAPLSFNSDNFSYQIDNNDNSSHQMDNTTEHALPLYDHEEAPNNKELPSYEAGPSVGSQHVLSTGPTVAIDPTGMFINELPAKDAQPLYSLSTSLLNVNNRSSVHISRPTRSSSGETSSLNVYAIGYCFISPLHNRKMMQQDVTATRTHGLLVGTNLKEVVWDFSTNVPRESADGVDGRDAEAYGSLFSGPPPGTVQKSLLQYYSGKWVNSDDEVVALAREGGEACDGMPVLSVVKDLDLEMMDFLVSAWCVTMWGEVGKRARHMSKSGGSKLSVGNFTLG